MPIITHREVAGQHLTRWTKRVTMIPCPTRRMFHTNTISLILSVMLISTAAAQTRVAPPSQKPSVTHRPSTDPLQEIESLIQKGQFADAEQKLQPLMPDLAKNPQA